MSTSMEERDPGAAPAKSTLAAETDEDKTLVSTETGQLVPELRFAPGYHFLPTDEELVDVYLRAKNEGRMPPLDVIMEVEILKYQPHKLVEDYKRYGENRWFFFTKREPSASNKENEPSRKVYPSAAPDVVGFTASWKATGSVAEILRSGAKDRQVIGTKRILIYHSNVAGEGDKWSMNEFVMADYPGMDRWVLCAIQTKVHWGTKGGNAKKPKRGAGYTSMEPKTAKRRKKTAASQAQEDMTSTHDGSACVPPLLMHEQDHQALHEGHLVSLTNNTSLIVDPVVSQDGDHYQREDMMSMQQQIVYDVPNLQPPLMTHHPAVYRTSQEDQQNHMISGNAFQYQDVVHDRQLSASIQMHPLYMSSSQQQQQDPMLFDYRYWPQHQQQHVSGYTGVLEMQRFDGDNVAATSQETIMALWGQKNHKVRQTSPNSVLGLQLQNANPYYNSSYIGMMLSSGEQHAVSAGDPNGDGGYMPGYADVLLNDSYDDSVVGNNGDGGNVGMTVLPDMSNQASHVCEHGVEWWGNGKCLLC